MDHDELKGLINCAFEPDCDDESGLPAEAVPHPRLKEVYDLDTSYWELYEFGSMSPSSRIVIRPDDPVNRIMPSITAGDELFYAALRLLGDSILAYHDRSDFPYRDRWGQLHYYPSVLFAFCAAFEAVVRFQAALLVQVSSGLPPPVRAALLEVEESVGTNLKLVSHPRRRPVLERYRILLKYGYDFIFERSVPHWPRAEAAFKARDSFVHYDVGSAPSITATDLCTHLEALLCLFVYPSARIGRTVYSRQYEVYQSLAFLIDLVAPFEERPILKNSAFFDSPHMFACTFAHVDATRYPSAEEHTRSVIDERRLNDRA